MVGQKVDLFIIAITLSTANFHNFWHIHTYTIVYLQLEDIVSPPNMNCVTTLPYNDINIGSRQLLQQ